MKTLFVSIVSATLLSLPGLAAPCTPGTLATYIAMGPSGCTLGNLQVAAFAYQAKASGGAAQITADQIQVTPLVAPTGSFALQFDAPWSVQVGQSQLSGITYAVAAPTPTIQIQQTRLDGSGFQSGLFGSVVVNEALAASGITRDLQIYTRCTEVCRSQTSTTLDLTPAVASMVVSDRVTLQSKQGSATLTGFADWLVVCVPCVI